jgi:predicted AlkP superfamily phosphohydrolase/phosphomutase
MILIGLDGLQVEAIEYFKSYLPTLSRITFEKLSISGIAHSAPSWTTIFTGVDWQEHNITGFQKPNRGEFFTPQDLKHPYIWETLNEAGISSCAINIPSLIPPVQYNTTFQPHFNVNGLNIDGNDLIQNLSMIEQSFYIAQALDYSFIAFVVVALDKAHHLSSRFCGNELDGALYAYKAVDMFVNKILNSINDDYIIISDHGLPAANYVHADGWSVPAHHPQGVFYSSINNVWPKQSNEVHNYMLSYYNVEHTDTIPDRDSGLTKEQEQQLLDHLEQLGYIE